MSGGLHWPDDVRESSEGRGVDDSFADFTRCSVTEILGGLYEIGEPLGEGGMSVVFQARRASDERQVALKVVRGDQVRDRETLLRFEREAELSLRLHHPNIVETLDVHELPPRGLVLAMELMTGGTLKERLRSEGRLGVEEAVAILRDVSAALAYAHRLGVVHRDVKPDNIFLPENGGGAKLGDFGIARGEGADTVTMHGMVIGTPAYMSPEQIEGRHTDLRSDLYSLGMVGWQLLTGQQPWVGETMAGVIKHQLMDHLPPITAFRADIPPHVLAALKRCVAKDPGERPPDASALLGLIEGRRPVVAPKAAPAPDLSSATIRFRAEDGASTPRGPRLASRSRRAPVAEPGLSRRALAGLAMAGGAVVTLATVMLMASAPDPPVGPGLAVPSSSVTAPAPDASAPAPQRPQSMGAAARPPEAGGGAGIGAGAGSPRTEPPMETRPAPGAASSPAASDPQVPGASAADEAESNSTTSGASSPTASAPPQPELWPEKRVREAVDELMLGGRYQEAARLTTERLRGDARARLLGDVRRACTAERAVALKKGMTAPVCPG